MGKDSFFYNSMTIQGYLRNPCNKGAKHPHQAISRTVKSVTKPVLQPISSPIRYLTQNQHSSTLCEGLSAFGQSFNFRKYPQGICFILPPFG